MRQYTTPTDIRRWYAKIVKYTPLQKEFKSIHTANSRSGFTCGVDTPTLTYAFPGHLESGLAEFITKIYLAISKEKTFPKGSAQATAIQNEPDESLEEQDY